MQSPGRSGFPEIVGKEAYTFDLRDLSRKVGIPLRSICD
jgi:hypothetical protein